MGPSKNPTTNAASLMQKVTNRGQSSAECTKQKETPKTGHTKENRTNSAAGAATTPTPTARPALCEITDGANTLAAMNARILEMQAALKKSEADKAALAEKLANVTYIEPDDKTITDPEDAQPSGKKKKVEVKIPRPVGDFNIQEAMGLTGSKKRRDRYMAIARTVKELVGNARINWELEWARIPVRDKAQFFEVVRDQIPEMAKYTNDWATEAIARQYMKNKRSYAVQRGFLEVDAKYEYLKANAAKRSDAPRGNGTGKRKVRGFQASSGAYKKARLAKTKGKGKEKMQNDDSGEEEEDESGDGGKKGEDEDEDIDN